MIASQNTHFIVISVAATKQYDNEKTGGNRALAKCESTFRHILLITSHVAVEPHLNAPDNA